MFFAAERESRVPRKRTSGVSDDGINVNADMEISVGTPPRGLGLPRRSINSVYPAFANMSMREIIQIADPNYGEEHSAVPPKKQRQREVEPVLSELVTPVGSPKGLPPQPAKASKPKCNTLEDLIRHFPELQSIIEEQEARVRDSRIPLEYVRQSERPKVAYIKPSLPSSEEPKPTSMFSNLPSPDTSVQPSAVISKTVTPPSEPEPVGGGLLAGIDDLFGDSKKSKLKSRKR